MSIICFRNQLDSNMKRFGGFLKRVREKSIYEVSLIFSPYKNKYIQEITSNKDATFIIVAHGSEHEIYHRYKGNDCAHQILLDTNANIFPDKVIAISCGTGKSLGKKMVEQGKCKVYLGFKSKLHFDKKYQSGSFISPYYSRHLKELYKFVFEKVLIQAIDNQWTFEKLSRVLQWELRKESVIRAKNTKSNYFHYYKVNDIAQTIIAATSVASNIVLIGNVEELVN